MPFGLCNALATFQRCIMSIFSDYIENIIKVFVDDFSVYGDYFDACLYNHTIVLKRCMDSNLVLNWEKCHFMVEQGIILEHIVSRKGIEVDKSKINLIRALPLPTSMKEVRSFLGHARFYKRFIKDFLKIARPLCRLLQKEVSFNLEKDCKDAFNNLKDLLTSAPIIQPRNWMFLAKEWAKFHMLYTMLQELLNDAQLNYSTMEKELFWIIFALNKF